MPATKLDFSGVFAAEFKQGRPVRAARFDKVSELSPKGITFISDSFWPEWTEVGVELRLPHGATAQDRSVGCHGVVVQCVPRDAGRGFEVALLFLDLPKRVQASLTALPSATSAPSVAVFR